MRKSETNKIIPIYSKIVIIILAGLSLIISYVMIFQRVIVNRNMLEIEDEYAQVNLKRSENILNQDLSYLLLVLEDYVNWDDAYEFISNPNQEYLESNFLENTFSFLSTNFVCILNLNKELIWGELYDLETGEKMDSTDFFSDYILETDLINDHSLLEWNTEEYYYNTGYLSTDLGIVQYISYPVYRSDDSGPPNGTMVMGRFLTFSRIEEMNTQMQTNFQIYLLKDLQPGDYKQEIFHELTNNENSLEIYRDKEKVYAYKVLDDIRGNPIILLEASEECRITKFGDKAMKYLRTGILVYLVSMTIILVLIFDNLVSTPLKKISSFLETVDIDQENYNLLQLSRNDEIGYLARIIDKFLRRINIQRTELRLLNEELKQLATTDALTGLYNRHILGKNTDILWNALSREKATISAIILDIDFFKIYNDTYGHQAGDECIKKVAEIIQRMMLRVTDLPIRYGGEEFLILLPSTPIKGAKGLATRIKDSIEGAQIQNENSKVSEYLTVSIGIACFVPSPINTLEKLIDDADRALYESKESGRNRITVYAHAEKMATS